MSEAALYNNVAYGLSRCPQCSVSNPLIDLLHEPTKHFTDDFDQTYYYFTGVCSKCRRHVLFYASGGSDAINGRVEEFWSGDELVGEKRVPSDRLLTWLLELLDPARFAGPWERRLGDLSDPQADVHAAFPALMAALTDGPVD